MSKQNLSPRPLHLAGILLLAVLWGLNWPAVKIALDQIPPWTLRAIGLSSASVVLLLTALVRRQTLVVPRREILPLLAAGLLSIAAFNVLLSFAQLYAATSRAVIVTFTMPIWTVILSRLLLGEKIDRHRMIGVVLGLAGLSALAWPLIINGEFGIGLVYALLAGIGWSLGSIITKRWPLSISPVSITAWQIVTGAVAATAGMLIFEGIPALHGLEVRTIAAMLYHVILALAVAYLLWFAILPHVPLGIASLGTLLVPAVGVLGATLVLGERPTIPDYIGLSLVTLAAFSILFSGRSKARARK